MIHVNVMYPNDEGSHFDMDYYLQKHIPLVSERWSQWMKGATLTKGLNAGAPDAPPSHQVIATLVFDSEADLGAALSTHGQEIMADIPNFTSVTPVIQVGEVLGG